MFGRRRGYGRGGGGGFGLILLAMQFFRFFSFLSGSDRYFPITLGVLAINGLLHFRPDIGIAWPSVHEACISAKKVWVRKDWKPIFLSPFLHGHDYHLYYNMASFMWKAVTLERHFGSGYFLYMTAVFSMVTGLLYVALEMVLSEVLDDWSYLESCAVGFSGVIFALKVVATHIQPRGVTMIMGLLPVPSRLACWAELVLISVLFPNVSFVGHLSGILVGVAFVYGPLKYAMDIPLYMIDLNTRQRSHDSVGGTRQYVYRAERTGYRERREPRNSEEEELQEAIALSLRQHNAAATDPHRDTPTNTTTNSQLQTAGDRSIRKAHREPSPPSEAPPPFNPYYNSRHSSSEEEDTSLHQDSLAGPRDSKESDSRRGVRQRHTQEAASKSDNIHTQELASNGNNLASLRAARLRKFNKEEKQK